MVVLKCKMCSGNIIPLPDGKTGVCESCGTTTILPSITDERRTDAFNRGNQFRKDFEFDKALEEYSQIVKEDPADAEAHFCMALCRHGIYYQKDYNDSYVPTFARLTETSFLEDPDYQAALKYAKDTSNIYKSEAQQIEKIRKELIRVAAQTEPYDVFICFKDTYTDRPSQRTPDSYAAQDIYMFLKDKGYKVFFSRITLKEEHLGQEWEPYIYAALNTARVMLVVGTSAEHYNSPWVKNEWNRFRVIRKKDPTKVLLACYQDMELQDVPVELQSLEAHNIKDPDGGFYSNLLRVVDRECNKNKKPVSAENRTAAENHVIRAFQYLDDRDFKKADQLLEQALIQDPENARAQLGKLLVSRKASSIPDLVRQKKPLAEDGNFARAVKYGDASLQQQLRAAEATIQAELEKDRLTKELNSLVSQCEKAGVSTELDKVISGLEALGDFSNAQEMLEKAREKQDSLRKVEEAEAERKRLEEERKAEEARLKKEREEREKAEKEEAERQRILKEQKKARAKRRNKRIRKLVILLVILGVAGYFLNKNFVEEQRAAYNLAEEYIAAGNYQDAAINYYAAAENPISRLVLSDAESKGYEALTNWLGTEPTVTTSAQEPWYSVEDGLLVIDQDKFYESGSDSFSLPTLVDGQLVHGLSDDCFYGWSGLTNITLPANYVTVGERCFYDCTSLSSVYLGPNTRSIGAYAFYDCQSLTAIVMPSSMREIGPNAFESCSYLSSVSFNDQLETIGESAFISCYSLTDVYIPGSVQNVGSCAFYDLEISNLSFGEGVGCIGSQAFAYCDNLTTVTIPGSVYEIGNQAFYSCDYLQSVVLGSGVTTIGEAAFSDCTTLSYIDFGDTITTIWDQAFYGDTALTSLTLPGSLTYIGEGAFMDCDSLYTLVLTDNDGLELAKGAFYSCDYLTSVSVGEGTLVLGDNAFSQCPLLSSITFPESLTTIGEWCFYTAGFTRLELPASLSSLGVGAFSENDSLVGITIHENVDTIRESTFAGCDSLYWIGIYEGVDAMEDDAFSGCTSLTQIYYTGTADSWYAISKGNNSWLENLQLISDYYG